MNPNSDKDKVYSYPSLTVSIQPLFWWFER